MYKATLILLSLWLLNNPLKAETHIELITMGAGHYYWEAFGHSAIRVKSGDSDLLYGFGYFNFNDDDFFLNFAKGEMQYFLGVEYTDIELDDYILQGRFVWKQTLELTTSQKNHLISKLNELALPENRYYHYDYFLSNCTSKIRDILDEITQGDISNQLKLEKTNKSWNDVTFPVTNQAWMNLGIAIAYGIPAYLDRSRWDLSIFPEDFAKDLELIKTNPQWNQPHQKIYQPTKQQAAFNQYSFIKTHYAVVSVVLILMLGMFLKFSQTFTINGWLIVQSLLGVGLLMLWFLTKHSVAAQNINILMFFPLSFLLIFKRFQKNQYFMVFLVLNLIWMILALLITNTYLLGFFLINVFILYKTRSNQS